ncbi:MAG: bisanhydrobacterioruberin hydratase [Candidatus Thermoplasmatota archaeon]|nr:bisanhydrobacterioruberin hydratase [Candidatus Thermoplasmatota archaeon]
MLAQGPRGALVARLDAFIARHRFTISVTFPVVGAILLIASAQGLLTGAWAWLSFSPWLILLGTLVMRSPLLAGLMGALDRRAVVGLLVVSAYAYTIEAIGLATGWPYGAFSYGVALGPTLAGVPLALPLFFIPLVLNAYLLSLVLLGARARRTSWRLGASLALVLCIDLVLDPGAVALGFWRYDGGGLYHGVPWTNFAGWVLSGSVALLVLDRTLDRGRLIERSEACPFMLDDMVSFVLLWGSVNAWAGNWVPVFTAALLGLCLWRTGRYPLAGRRPHRVARA